MGLVLTACGHLTGGKTNIVAIHKDMVHSYHLGTDAQAQNYLLVVLNEQGTQMLNATAKQGEPYSVSVQGKAFLQTARVHSGFLVLSPVPSEWNQTNLPKLFD